MIETAAGESAVEEGPVAAAFPPVLPLALPAVLGTIAVQVATVVRAATVARAAIAVPAIALVVVGAVVEIPFTSLLLSVLPHRMSMGVKWIGRMNVPHEEMTRNVQPVWCREWRRSIVRRQTCCRSTITHFVHSPMYQHWSCR